MKFPRSIIALAGLAAVLNPSYAAQELTGKYAPTGTPAKTPAAAQAAFTLPEGFEMRLFASEPMVINPVAMSWDARGRLWVVELFEYPLGAPKGAKPRDRVKILEDTNYDGLADKMTVFADGLNLATGIVCANGGAYIGQAPHLYFMKDTDGDDVADVKEIAMTGFGLEDRHELLNGFTWGPDGYLYMTHGVFTFSKVRDPDDPDDDGVTVDAAVARFRPSDKKFEVFADGTSNPWGVDFDRYGNAFVSACVIDHLFHMAPGGQYSRQGGIWANAYGYASMHSQRGGLSSIVDHRHHLAAYSGVQVYQGNQYPEEYLGTIMMGNIHDNSVHQDGLKRNGSSFIASHLKDFIRTTDGWFRPVSQQVGPDGALWVMDWYDKYPCYQNARANPEGVDREYGRIWRAVYVGDQPGKEVPPRIAKSLDLEKMTTRQLVKFLAHPNVWMRETAQRVLIERGDDSSQELLVSLLQDGLTLESRLHSLWTLHGCGLLTGAVLDSCAEDKDWPIRMWAARLTGERGQSNDAVIDRLTHLATDEDASVRLAVATAARQLVSRQLTVNDIREEPGDVGDVLTTLIRSSADGKDPLIPFLIWMAAEPLVAADPQPALDWMLESGPATRPLSEQLTTKLMRRLCDTQQREALDRAVLFVSSMVDQDKVLTRAALDGLLEGQKGKAILPTISTSQVLAKLRNSGDEELGKRAQQLGSLWGDATAIKNSIDLAKNGDAAVSERLKAIDAIRKQRNPQSRQVMVDLISSENPEPVKVAAIQGMGSLGIEPVVDPLLAAWPAMTAAERRSASEVLSSRHRWQSSFLSALEQKDIQAGDVPPTAVRTLIASEADFGMLSRRAELIFGRVRGEDKDKARIIEQKKRMILTMDGEPDLKNGHELAKQACLVCHKMYGEGADIGPDLTGVGRSSLEALLSNIIDPNQIIGAGYENVIVETRDGQNLSGRMVENSDARVKLLALGPQEHVIAKSDIKELKISDVSVMPEGLHALPDKDFRDLVAFILNPPQDNAPFSWKVEKPLEKQANADHQHIDWESVSLWNPEWEVAFPEFEGTPRRVDYAGRRNVLETHPFSREAAGALRRKLDVPKAASKLQFMVAAHPQGDWQLQVVINGKTLHQETVTHDDPRWKIVSVDLSDYAGKTVEARLEHHANNWAWEFGYWSDIKVIESWQAKAK